MRGPLGALSYGFVRVGLVAALAACVFNSEGVHKGNGQELPLGRAGMRNSVGISTGIDGTSPVWGDENDSVYGRCDLLVPLFPRMQRSGGELAHLMSCLRVCRSEEEHLNASLIKSAFAIVRNVVRSLRECCMRSQVAHYMY